MTWPLPTLAATSASISGVSTSPAFVADSPSTPWTNSGTNMIAPNIATPTVKEVAAAALKVRRRKSDSGTIGFGVRRSCQPSTASRAEPGGEQRGDLDRVTGRGVAEADGAEQHERQARREQRRAQ